MNKKIIVSLLAGCCTAFTACDMDLTSETSIATNESVQSVLDCQKYSDLFHSEWRGYVQNAYAMDGLVQSGLITATADYGNTYGAFYRWDYTITDGAFSGCWANNYNYIANANVLLKGGQALLDANTLSEKDQELVRLYMGHAYFSRAMAYFELALHFCKNYDQSTASSDYGVPLVYEYNPSSNAGTYPGRSSLAETFQQINEDLAMAEQLVTTPGEQNSAYITADVVKALKARVALEQEDYASAIAAATSLIKSGTYPLMSDAAAYTDMWIHDNGTEAIWQFKMVKGTEESCPNSLGSSFAGIIDVLPRPSYIPTKTVLALYDQENDIRYDAYFKYDTIDAQSVADFPLTYCIKWPGNPDLHDGKTERRNQNKAFRISEMYLIAAEAYAMSGDEANASAMLNELKSARIQGWNEVNYSGTALMKEIQDEYVRELFAENPHIFNMKRWGIGLNRSVAEAQVVSYLPALGTDMVKSADDPWWVWPIPKEEIDSNPQIKDQQNEGY